MKRILWLSNFRFDESASASSGTWIEAMGKGIAASGQYELFNVVASGTAAIHKSDACGIRQWVLPYKKQYTSNAPSRLFVEFFQQLEDDLKPDLIHVWGTESVWGLLTARRYLKTRALLEMQGLPGAMVPYMTGCLAPHEVWACQSVKEFLKPKASMLYAQHVYENGWAREQEIIRGHRFIDCQSDWVKSYLEPTMASGTRVFKTRMILREEFLQAVPWCLAEGNRTIFTSCGCAPNKGLHTLVRAVAFLKGLFPEVSLRVAGGLQSGIKTSGYQRWIMREIARLGLKENVRFLGGLTAQEQVVEMQHAAVVVVPSFVESYSMSLAEAMAVGCPCIASYAGAMPEVGGDTVRYFPIADAGACAGEISRLFRDAKCACELGAQARMRSRLLHQAKAGVDRQLEIYKAVLEA